MRWAPGVASVDAAAGSRTSDGMSTRYGDVIVRSFPQQSTA